MENEKMLYAGYSEAVVTPPMGLKIPGYFSTRLSDGIINDLHLRTVAFSDGEEKAVFFSCECIGIRQSAAKIIKEMVSQRCGIKPEAIYIACNHSHTAFRITPPDENDPEMSIFLKRLYLQFCDCAQFAFEDLKPASLKSAKGEAKGVGFMRRYRMKDGTVKTNPGTGNPDILHFEGEQDDSLQLVRVIREGAKELLLINYGTHADVIGGTKYCADFTGYTTEYLKGAFGGDVLPLFFNGAEGDSNHCNRFLPKGTLMKGVPVSERMGRILAGEVLKIYDDAKEISGAKITSQTVTVQIGKNPYDPADIPEAKEVKKIYLEKGNKAPELANYKLNVPEALRILANLERPEFFNISMSIIQVGDLVFVGIPGEPFQKIGTDIKEASKFDSTFVTCCTNGGEGYYPTKEAFAERGYERSTSPFAHDCAEILVNGAVGVLKGLEPISEK